MSIVSCLSILQTWVTHSEGKPTRQAPFVDLIIDTCYLCLDYEAIASQRLIDLCQYPPVAQGRSPIFAKVSGGDQTQTDLAAITNQGLKEHTWRRSQACFENLNGKSAPDKPSSIPPRSFASLHLACEPWKIAPGIEIMANHAGRQ